MASVRASGLACRFAGLDVELQLSVLEQQLLLRARQGQPVLARRQLGIDFV
jgi:hypothetical protein